MGSWSPGWVDGGCNDVWMRVTLERYLHQAETCKGLCQGDHQGDGRGKQHLESPSEQLS